MWPQELRLSNQRDGLAFIRFTERYIGHGSRNVKPSDTICCYLLRQKWNSSLENGIAVQTGMGVTFTKRHRYGDREIQPAEENMAGGKKTANIEILVYGKKYYTNGAGKVGR